MNGRPLLCLVEDDPIMGESLCDRGAGRHDHRQSSLLRK